MALHGEEPTRAKGARSFKAKLERRESLRIRVPQVEDVMGTPAESDSDSESEDEVDEINDDVESDDDTDGAADDDDPPRMDLPQWDPPGAQPTAAPGFITLVPGGSPTQTRGGGSPQEEPFVTANPSQPVSPPESIVDSAPGTEPTTTAKPSNPTEPSGLPVEEDAESLISDTSLLASSTAVPTSAPSGDVEQVGSNEGGRSLNRGADVGIIIGTMALAAMIVAGCVLWYRRRTMRKANEGHLVRLDEKPLPLDPGSGEKGGASRTQLSSWANFIRPNGDDTTAQDATGYYAGNEKSARPVSTLSPAAPNSSYGAAGAFRSLTGQEPPPQMTSRYGGGPVEGRLVPPPTTYHLTPPPRKDVYPPGQVPINQHRTQLRPPTAMTKSTEGTWRTWDVDQRPRKG